jgi:hypothetical protein
MKDGGDIIKVINEFGKLELGMFRSKDGSISNRMQHNIVHVGDLIERINPELAGIETYEELEKVVTYTYR